MSAAKADDPPGQFPKDSKKATSKKGMPTGYHVNQHGSGWHATPAGIFTGNLFYDKGTDSYRAVSYVRMNPLTKAPKGFRNAQESPAHGNGEIKSEFYMLAYMRLFKRYGEFSDVNPTLLKRNTLLRFRRWAIGASIRERESESGKPVSEKAWQNAGSIMESHAAFSKWFSLRFGEIWETDDAAETLERYAKWIRAIDRALADPPDPDEERFLRAVEAAAAKCGGVPTSADVKKEFYGHKSQNRIGVGSTFRTIKNRLAFNWLPGLKPGKPARKSNRAGKSAT